MSGVLDLNKWREFLPTVEMVVDSLPNKSIGCSPFFLMYRYHLVLPIELLKGDKSTTLEKFSKFLETMQDV